MRRQSALMRAVAAVVVVIALVAAVAGCGDADDGGGSGDGPIKIGFVGALSGSGAVFADQSIQSLELAVAEIDRGGGIDGRKVEIVTADDGSDPKTAQQVRSRLIQQEKVDVILSIQNSANREACLPEVNRGDNTPYLYASLYEGKECAPNFFVDGEVPSQSVAPLVEYLVNERGTRKVYFVGSDYVAPRSTNKYGKERLEALGATVVGEDYAPLGSEDFTPLISKVLRSDADTLITSAVGADEIALLKQFKDSPGSDKLTLASFTLPLGAGDAAKGVLFASSYFSEVPTDVNRAYEEALRAKFGSDYENPSILAAATYTFVNAYKQAVEKAGTTDHDEVDRAFNGLTVTGPGGKMTFNDQGHAALPISIAEFAGDPLAGGERILKSYEAVEPGDQSDGDCGR